MLQVAAYTNDNNEVSIWDCWLLQHCLWATPEQREVIFDWYQSRVGTKAAFNPEKFSKLVAAWENKLEYEKNSKTQVHDEEGNLLYVLPNGETSIQSDRTAYAEKNCEPIYLAPPNQKARTNKGKGYTAREFRQHFNMYGYDDRFHNGQEWVYLKDYFENNENRLVWESKPLMQTLYSQHHIKGRVEEIDKIVKDMTEYLAQIDEQIISLTETINDHLWITPGFSEPAKSILEQTRKTVEDLRVRMTTVHEGFSNLPVEEV